MWKDIPGYEKLYQASIFGAIKSLDRNLKQKSKHGGYLFRKFKGKVLKQKIDRYGYKCVTLCDSAHNKKSFTVHRLVILTFKGKSPLQVNHIDCNKLNNNLSNLEYCTALENVKHANENGLRTIKYILSENQQKEVIDMFFKKIPVIEISRKFNISRSPIYTLLYNKKITQSLKNLKPRHTK